MDGDLSNLTTFELVQLTYGCTEATCLYHGVYNRELRRRKAAEGGGE